MGRAVVTAASLKHSICDSSNSTVMSCVVSIYMERGSYMLLGLSLHSWPQVRYPKNGIPQALKWWFPEIRGFFLGVPVRIKHYSVPGWKRG